MFNRFNKPNSLTRHNNGDVTLRFRKVDAKVTKGAVIANAVVKGVGSFFATVGGTVVVLGVGAAIKNVWEERQVRKAQKRPMRNVSPG